MEQEQSKRDCAREQRRKQRDTVSEESKAREKESDTHMTLRSLSETLQMTTLPSSLLYLVSNTWHLHTTCGYNGYVLAYFWIFFCTRHTLCMRIPSIYVCIAFMSCRHLGGRGQNKQLSQLPLYSLVPSTCVPPSENGLVNKVEFLGLISQKW